VSIYFWAFQVYAKFLNTVVQADFKIKFSTHYCKSLVICKMQFSTFYINLYIVTILEHLISIRKHYYHVIFWDILLQDRKVVNSGKNMCSISQMFPFFCTDFYFSFLEWHVKGHQLLSTTLRLRETYVVESNCRLTPFSYNLSYTFRSANFKYKKCNSISISGNKFE